VPPPETEGQDSAHGHGLLTCTFLLSGNSVLISTFPGMQVVDVAIALGRLRQIPSSCIQLVDSAGAEVSEICNPVELCFPEGAVGVVVTPESFNVGDTVKALWSAHKVDYAGLDNAEGFYSGHVTSRSFDDVTSRFCYDIWWDEGTHSTDVHFTDGVWRTSAGGVIFSLHKQL
jgi:hypothetical protein